MQQMRVQKTLALATTLFPQCGSNHRTGRSTRPIFTDFKPILRRSRDTPWTTKTAVGLQLAEIEGVEAMDRDRLVELREFYRHRISKANLGGSL